jgi:hypothetical protein
MTDPDPAAIALLPCPFCGGGETLWDETHMPPRMNGPGALVSVEVRHWCAPLPGLLSRSSVVFAGRDHASAAAAWNRRAVLEQEARDGE